MGHLIITGAHGIGKSTLLKKAIGKPPPNLAGYITHEILEEGVRVGFETEVFGGDRHLLLHRTNCFTNFHYFERGLYCNLDVIHRVLCPLIEQALEDDRPLVIDEISRVLLLAGELAKNLILRAFDRTVPTIAIVQNIEYGEFAENDPFIVALHKRKGLERWPLYMGDRDERAEELKRRIDVLR